MLHKNVLMKVIEEAGLYELLNKGGFQSWQ